MFALVFQNKSSFALTRIKFSVGLEYIANTFEKKCSRRLCELLSVIKYQLKCLKLLLTNIRSQFVLLSHNVLSCRKKSVQLIWCHLILTFISVLCFANSINGDFVHDDIPAVINNPDANGKSPLMNVFKNDFWGTSMKDPRSHKSYRPLTILTFRLNTYLSGGLNKSESSFSFHVVNLILHSSVVQLVAILGRNVLMFNTESTFMLGLYFATHPIHTEAVSNIVGRADLLSAVFVLISFLCYPRALNENMSLKWNLFYLLLNSTFACLALLSKETGITVLLICILYYFHTKYTSYSKFVRTSKPFSLSLSSSSSSSSISSISFPLHSKPRRQISVVKCLNRDLNQNEFGYKLGSTANLVNKVHVHKLCPKMIEVAASTNIKGRDSYCRLLCPILIPIITLIFLLWLRLHILYGQVPRFMPQDNPASFAASFHTRCLTYAYLMAFNGHLLVFPSNLSYDWQMGSISLIESWLDKRNSLTFLLLTLIGSLVRQYFQSSAGNLTSLIRKESEAIGCSEESCMNQTSQGILLGLSFLILPLIPASNIFVTVGFVVAERLLYIPSLGLGILTIIGLQKLCKCSTFKRYSSAFKLAFYILILVFIVKTVRRNQVWLSREALFRSGLESVPTNAKVHYNYANLQKDLRLAGDAINHYKVALSLWPDHESAHNNLAVILPDIKEAEMHLKRVIQINPFHFKAYFNLATIYSKKGLSRKAIHLLKRSVQLNVNYLEASSFLAQLHTKLGNLDEGQLL